MYGDDYTVDPDNSVANSVIADADIVIDGTENIDAILGNKVSDRLFGGLGKDTVIGGTDNDAIADGEGGDCLIGVELNSSQPDLGEQNTLAGGVGADSFILGNEAGVFYSDGDSSAFGDADFATINDLNAQEDKIELFGDVGQYSLEFSQNDMGNTDAELIYSSGLDAEPELVAFLSSVSEDLSINEPIFTFI